MTVVSFDSRFANSLTASTKAPAPPARHALGGRADGALRRRPVGLAVRGRRAHLGAELRSRAARRAACRCHEARLGAEARAMRARARRQRASASARGRCPAVRGVLSVERAYAARREMARPRGQRHAAPAAAPLNNRPCRRARAAPRAAPRLAPAGRTRRRTARPPVRVLRRLNLGLRRRRDHLAQLVVPVRRRVLRDVRALAGPRHEGPGREAHVARGHGIALTVRRFRSTGRPCAPPLTRRGVRVLEEAALCPSQPSRPAHPRRYSQSSRSCRTSLHYSAAVEVDGEQPGSAARSRARATCRRRSCPARGRRRRAGCCCGYGVRVPRDARVGRACRPASGS